MNNTRIEFAEQSADITTQTTTTPWKRERESRYQDLVFKPEYAARKLRFPLGQTWMRILPPLRGSVNGPLLGIHAVEFDGGRFAHPRTLKTNAKCAFDHAYGWAKENTPESLYSKANRKGVRLLSNPFATFWVAVEEEGRTVARLFFGSAYDGSRGGVAGLGWQIFQMSQQKDETGSLIADLAHPKNGVLVGVEKVQAKGAQYPTYRLQIGRQSAPADEAIAKMDEAEVAALVPLEYTIRVLTPEEEWECLSKVMASSTVEQIRAGL